EREPGRTPQQLREVRLFQAPAFRHAVPRGGQGGPDAGPALQLRGGQRCHFLWVGIDLERRRHARSRPRQLAAAELRLGVELRADGTVFALCHGCSRAESSIRLPTLPGTLVPCRASTTTSPLACWPTSTPTGATYRGARQGPAPGATRTRC